MINKFTQIIFAESIVLSGCQEITREWGGEMIVGIIILGLWMFMIMDDIWSIKKRLDKLEEENNENN